MISQPLRIGYGGTLAGFDPALGHKEKSFFRRWLWTYNAENIDFSTRTGYFFFKAIELLKKNDPALSQKLRIELWGNIYSLNKKQVKDFGIEDIVSIEGMLPKEESLKRMKTCQLMWLPLEQGTAGTRSLFIPGKVYEILAARIPVFATAAEGDCRDILDRSGLAVVAPANNPEAIARKLAELIDAPSILKSLKPDESYINQLSSKESCRKLAALFDRLYSHLPVSGH